MYTPQIQENNFQAVVVTNEVQSYTVFTYQCGELNWVCPNSASIGFSASSTSFANHLLSQQPNVNDIACINQQCPPWTNVHYQINGDTLIVLVFFLFIPNLYFIHATIGTLMASLTSLLVTPSPTPSPSPSPSSLPIPVARKS